MTIHEPMTLATDYLLAGVTGWLAWRLSKESAGQASRRFWKEAFILLAIGAFLGGTWHGFMQNDILWKAALLSLAAVSFAMVVGSVHAVFSGRTRTVLTFLATAKMILAALLMLMNDDFIIVIADTGIAFAAVAAMHLWRFNGWFLAGVAVSVAAGLVQASGFALHRHFNHNDLYHVIQIAAMLLLYRGARVLRDS